MQLPKSHTPHKVTKKTEFIKPIQETQLFKKLEIVRLYIM